MSFDMHCMSTQSLFGEASMLGHGARIGYTGPGWAPLTISVWWRGRSHNGSGSGQNTMTTTVYHNRLFYLLQRGVHSRSAPGSNFPPSSSLFPRLRSRSPSPSPLPFLSVILSPSLRRRAAQSNEAASLYGLHVLVPLLGKNRGKTAL